MSNLHSASEVCKYENLNSGGGILGVDKNCFSDSWSPKLKKALKSLF